MATIGVASGSYIRPYRRGRMRRMRVDTSQTIVVGDLLVLSADADEGDRVKKSGADPTTDRFIVGFAAGAITTSSTVAYPRDEVDIWLASGDAEFIGHVCGAAVADGTLDNNDLSVEYGLLADSTNGIWRVDQSETTAKLVRILELADAHGDTNGRVVFHVIAPERLYND